MRKLTEMYKAGAVWAHSFDSPEYIRSLGTVTNLTGVANTPLGRAASFAAGGVTWPSVTATCRSYVWDGIHYAYDGAAVYTDGVLIGTEPITISATGFSGETGAIQRVAFWDALTAADIAVLATQSLTAYRRTLAHHWRMAAEAPRDDVTGEGSTAVGSPTVVAAGRGYGLMMDGADDRVAVTGIDCDGGTFACRLRWDGGACTLIDCDTGSVAIGADGSITASAGTAYVDHDSTADLVAGQPATLVVSGITLTGAGNIGASQTPDAYLAGQLADVRMYSDALTPLQVRHLTWEMDHGC